MAKATREAYGEELSELVVKNGKLSYWMQTLQVQQNLQWHKKYVRSVSLIWASLKLI